MSVRTAQIIGPDPQKTALEAELVARGWTMDDAGMVFFVGPVDLDHGRRALSEGRDCILLGPRSDDDGQLFLAASTEDGRVCRVPAPNHAAARARWRAEANSDELGGLSALVFETFSVAPVSDIAPDALAAALQLVAGEPRTVEFLGTAETNSIHLIFDGGFRVLFTQHHTPHYSASRWSAMGARGIALFEGSPGQFGRHSLRIIGGSTAVTETTDDTYSAMLATMDELLADENRSTTIAMVVDAVLRARAEKQSVPIIPPAGQGYFLHPTVDVDGEVTIGAGTRVWHFSKLLGPLRIGENCSFGQNVVVERNVEIGHNVKIQNNVSVYSGVILEDDVFCGPSMVFTNVGTPRSHYPRKGQYTVTRVCRGASIGANATVVCGHTLGRYSFVGAGAVVTRDVPDFALVYGNPARVMGWSCYCGVRLPMGVDAGSEHGECPECSRRYAREGHTIRPLDEETS